MTIINKFKPHFTFLIYVFAIVNALAQKGIPIGTWRTHNSYFEAQAVEIAGSKVWTGTSGGLFYLDKDDQSINRLTKLDGLSGFSISALKYFTSRDLLVVGYEDGTLDIIKKGVIYNNSDIVKSNKSGLKRINHISIYNQYALISCGFGAVLFDVDRMEIKESYLNIGSNGSSPSINASALKGDSVFLATSNGIYAAKFGSGNLIDFKNWKTIQTVDSLTSTAISSIAILNNYLYFGAEKRGIYSNASGKWDVVVTMTGTPGFITSNNTDLYVSAEDTIIRISNTSISYIRGGYVYKLGTLVTDPDGSLWYADGYYGLVNYKEGNFSYFRPNGPFYNQAFAFYPYNGKMVALSGGFGSLGGGNSKYKGYYEFEYNEWKNYIPGQNTGYISDATGAAYNTFRNTLYIATANEGVMAVNQNTGAVTFINDETVGCSLHRAAPDEFPDYDNVRAVSVFNDDRTDNVWICNNLGTFNKYNTIFKLKENNTCDSYTFPVDGANFPVQILVDDSGNKWVRSSASSGGNLYVFNEEINAAAPPFMPLKTGIGAGNLTGSVNCMIKDRNGDMWIGTSQGVCVFYSPGDIVNKIFDATTPVFQNRPLLFDQAITCMDVDGGNRKWIGTSNGLYLFSPDGTQAIHYFNMDNSPMFSNNIVSVKADPITGEVFIGTDVNIVSYREAATTGVDTPDGIDIFPNPVSQGYNGQIGFIGLGTDAVVKIVDIAGNKVYETKANGGAASWNARDYKGRKISPGVYVVLTSKDDGTAAVAGKLFVTE